MRSTVSSIKILFINVGTCSSAHEIALQLAFKTNMDVLLIQEPYVYKDLTRKISRKHPSFECFTPINDWHTRPRVLTCSRKNTPLYFSQIRPISGVVHGPEDALLLTANSSSGFSTLIINIYKPPPGDTNPGAGVSFLISFLISLTELSFPPKTILAGDFNLHRHNCHSSRHGSPSSHAETLIRRLQSRDVTG